jgi:sec-independent protein translocase protein TatA
MLGLDNPIHIAFILVLLLLVFGAKRLPEMGKSLGAGLRGFKDSISGEDHTEQLTASAHAPVPVDAVRETGSGSAAEVSGDHTARQPVA